MVYNYFTMNSSSNVIIYAQLILLTDSASTSTTPSDFCSAPHEPLPPTATPERSSLKRRGDVIADGCTSPKAKKKRSLSFQSVTVYYFPRAQGFTCVPSQVRAAHPF
jgi:Cysteine/serine-rich nuclear protein N-terminus